jgi:hypothetical protein
VSMERSVMRNRIRVTPAPPGGRDWEPGLRWALTLSRSAGSARIARMRASEATDSPTIAGFPQDQAGARWRKTLRLA